jgi:hypothetical protein
MAAIPVFILEEHPESCLAWDRARPVGMIEAEGNHLLHADFHGDFSRQVRSDSIRALEPWVDAKTGEGCPCGASDPRIPPTDRAPHP